MLYMVTFTINIPPMFAYMPYMDPMGYIYIYNRIRKFHIEFRKKVGPDPHSLDPVTKKTKSITWEFLDVSREVYFLFGGSPGSTIVTNFPHCRIRQISHTDAELDKREKINRLTASRWHVYTLTIKRGNRNCIIYRWFIPFKTHSVGSFPATFHDTNGSGRTSATDCWSAASWSTTPPGSSWLSMCGSARNSWLRRTAMKPGKWWMFGGSQLWKMEYHWAKSALVHWCTACNMLIEFGAIM